MEKYESAVRIDSALVERLKDYKRIAKCSLASCVNEAVEDWLNCVAPARLEALQKLSRNQIKSLSA